MQVDHMWSDTFLLVQILFLVLNLLKHICWFYVIFCPFVGLLECMSMSVFLMYVHASVFAGACVCFCKGVRVCIYEWCECERINLVGKQILNNKMAEKQINIKKRIW